jgi:hypothetical protein
MDQIVHVMAVKTLGDLPHSIPPPTDSVSEVWRNDDGCSGLDAAAYDDWALTWKSEE